MNLHTIERPQWMKRRKTRVGRGGKRGTTSGHGTKGQKSRSGHRIRPAVRDLIQRLPKLRGTKNKSRIEGATPVNVGMLDQFEAKSIIDPKALKAAGFIRSEKERVKILGDGKLTKALIVRGISVSKKAKEKIELAKGTIEAGS
ncbi:MAG: 50S ribosomal protein L15 [Patescibacteria group bacterium]